MTDAPPPGSTDEIERVIAHHKWGPESAAKYRVWRAYYDNATTVRQESENLEIWVARRALVTLHMRPLQDNPFNTEYTAHIDVGASEFTSAGLRDIAERLKECADKLDALNQGRASDDRAGQGRRGAG